MRLLILRSIGAFVALFIASGAMGATIWSTGSKTVTKADGADWTLAENQDFITSNVTLTRGYSGLYCNVTNGDLCAGGNFDFGAPTDTEWAIGSIENWDSLTYDELDVTNGAQGNILGFTTYVVHLITDDIYFELTGLSWTSGGGGGAPACEANPSCGGFSYVRTTTVPIPAAVWLFGSALGMLGWTRRRVV